MLPTNAESDWETLAPDDELMELNADKSWAYKKTGSRRRTVNLVLSDSHISLYAGMEPTSGRRQTLPLAYDTSVIELRAQSPERLHSFYSSSSIYSNSEEVGRIEPSPHLMTAENAQNELLGVTHPLPTFNRSMSKSCLIPSQSKTSSSISTDRFLYDNKRYTAVGAYNNRPKNPTLERFNAVAMNYAKNPLDSFYNNGAVLST